MPVIPVLRKQKQRIPGTCWPTSLAKSVSSRLLVRDPVSKLKVKSNQGKHLISTTGLKYINVHIYAGTYTNMHTYIKTIN